MDAGLCLFGSSESRCTLGRTDWIRLAMAAVSVKMLCREFLDQPLYLQFLRIRKLETILGQKS